MCQADSNQPAYLCSAVRSESLAGTFCIAKNAKFLHVDNKHCSDCTDAQTDLNLHWVHVSDGTFDHVTNDTFFAHVAIFCADTVILIGNAPEK